MKLSFFATLLAVSLSFNAFAKEGSVCPEGSMMDVNNPSVCIKEPNCSPCDEGWFYKHPKNEKGYDKAACVKCAGGYTWEVKNKKCVPLLH